MDGAATDQQRRKRKRIARPLYFYSFSGRSLLLCFAFLSFLYLLSRHIPITPSSFRPVLKVSSFPLLSSTSTSTSTSRSNLSIQLYPRNRLGSPVKIEDRVLFPDHVLLLVANLRDWRMKKGDWFDCVYFTSSDIRSSLKRKALSFDDWNDLQSIVRCPLPPPGNYTAATVSLEIQGRKSIDAMSNNRTAAAHSWETVAYAAALDGDTAVVFAKGLNLRPDRESDPKQFSCHFGLGIWESDKRYMITTKAITAAQEVVRCSLPRSIRLNPSKAQGVRVTVGVTPPRKSLGRVLVPSVAKISNPKTKTMEGETKKKKYELCACTMVWNQAAALREWIQYHTWLGIEKWFIYDNNSDDGINEVVRELQQEDYNVSSHVWPWIKTQEAGFSHCALRAKEDCNWVGFMDVDEFFYFPFPTQRNQKLGFPKQNSLRTLVANFSSTTVAEIRTSCHSFGPSGLSSPPPQGVTAGYTCRLQSPERHKSIIRPDALDTTLLNVVHHFHLRKGFTYLNLPQGTAVINHYKYQVWESFRAKFFRRVATYVADWQENQNEGSRDRAPGLGTEAIEPPDWRLRFCEVWDTGLRDYVLANLADSATGLLPWERTSL